MSKIAIISDVHGNYLALLEIFKDMEKRGVTKIYCLGDIALKYVDPATTTELIRDNCEKDGVVQGNVDYHFATTTTIPLNRKYCGIENLEYLKNLPFSKDLMINGFHIRLLHSSPLAFDRIYNPNIDNSNTRYKEKTITDPNELFQKTNKLNNPIDTQPDIVFFGHTHISKIEKVGNGYIINPGSVGDPVNIKQDYFGKITETIGKEISYVILDDTKKQQLDIELVRIPYKNLLLKVKKRVENSPLNSKMNIDRIDASLSYILNDNIPTKGCETCVIKR